jgi:hypothetical protein
MDMCSTAPFADELQPTLLLALPTSFVWQSYSSGPPNADGWSACSSTPCGTCSVFWGEVDADKSLATASFSATCQVPGSYNRNQYGCAIDFEAADAVLTLDVTPVYTPTNRRITWVLRSAPAISAAWVTGAEHTCDSDFRNFNLEVAEGAVNDSLAMALDAVTLAYQCTQDS